MTDVDELTGIGQPGGGSHHRAWIGAPETYDLWAHMQFSLLTLMGLRQDHRVLDIGCGSLRGGKFLLLYLLPDRYFGIEPEQWAVEQGLEREVGQELTARTRPQFRFAADFPCESFGVTFDYIIATSVLSHASRAQVVQCMTRARLALAPGGMFLASFHEGESDYQGDAWVYPETVRYQMATMQSIAASCGLVAQRVEWFHSGGQTWLALSRPEDVRSVADLATFNTVAPMRVEVAYYRKRQEKLDWLLDHPVTRGVMASRRIVSRLLPFRR
jgi:SAM-dependent methyltransferase